MAPHKVGVVLLPMVFGVSNSFFGHAQKLRDLGYTVHCFDPYESKGRLIPPLPPLADRLARRLNQRKETLLDEVQEIVNELEETCDDVVLMGFGYGAVLALWFAEERQSLPVIGWYPHLVFPAKSSNRRPPMMEAIVSPIWLFFGGGDKIIPDSADRARAAGKDNAVVHVIPGADHAFADRKLVGWFPSPKFSSAAEEESWFWATSILGEISSLG